MTVVEKLVETLLEAKKHYYNGIPIMTDSEFDNLEDELRRLDPGNAYFSIVGTNVKGSNKVSHEVPMLSCGKAKSVDDVRKWLKKISCENEVFVVMPKIDGLSASVIYRNGKLSRIATRGDGKIGQDITWLADYGLVPKTIGNRFDKIEFRGEIYLPKNTNYPEKGPLRNLASGLVNRKSERENCKYLKFISYYVDSDSLYRNFFSEKLQFIANLQDIPCVSYEGLYINDLEDYFKKYQEEYRSKWLFETDGLVLQIEDINKYEKINSKYEVTHHNHFTIALKPPSMGVETTLRAIEWGGTKLGNIVPVAIFDSIFISDRNTTNATLNNYENLKSLNLGPGDKVYITIANEVIPFFHHVVEYNSIEKFDIEFCPYCKTKLIRDGVHIACPNENCSETNIQKITAYCKDCEMDGISEATIRLLYEHEFIKTVLDLYDLHNQRSLLLQVDGLGDSKIDNLFKQIEKSKKQTIVQFIARLNIKSVGERAVKNLGIDTRKKFLEFKDTTYVNGNSIIEFREKNKEFIDKLLTIIDPVDIIQQVKSKGKVAMTGSGPRGRKELEKELVEMGYEPTSSISKDTSILLCENPSSGSSKLEKAQKLGIDIKAYSEFFK